MLSSFCCANLDITGTLPAAVEVCRFVESDGANKRNQILIYLLDASLYAAWWATRMADWDEKEPTNNSITLCRFVSPTRDCGTNGCVSDWGHNVPYDEIIEGIVTAESRQEGESYLDYAESMTAACRPGKEELFAARDGRPSFPGVSQFPKTSTPPSDLPTCSSAFGLNVRSATNIHLIDVVKG